MPLPTPNKGEKQSDFISRCMGNETMKKEYTEQDQRAAVCYSQWRRHKKDDSAHVVQTEGGRVVSEHYVDGT